MSILVALVLLIGAHNVGLGVDSTPQPLVGLMAAAVGMIIWCATSWLVRPLPWLRTFLVASYLALLVLVLQAFVAAYDTFGRLSDVPPGESRVELKAGLTFNIGFGLLSFICACALRICTRQRAKAKPVHKINE
ncbi:MAG TPA: hypothetical protein VES66_03165 [Terriglobales bacterium]|nr:hypothetical protein [Terriglobales bacterium]